MSCRYRPSKLRTCDIYTDSCPVYKSPGQDTSAGSAGCWPARGSTFRSMPIFCVHYHLFGCGMAAPYRLVFMLELNASTRRCSTSASRSRSWWEREKLIETSDEPCVQQVRQLMKLVALGPNSAWLFVMEFFAWRKFRNRREVGGLAGLTPTPYQSGGESREQGISKAGNRPVRAMAIEIAWCWLRYQPHSELARWYYDNFGHGGKRMRKVGIVALARKLLVALWRYLETGEIPAGAQLKP